jgi:hypothetical protein
MSVPLTALPIWVLALMALPCLVIWLQWGRVAMEIVMVQSNLRSESAKELEPFPNQLANPRWWSDRNDHIAPELPELRRKARRLVVLWPLSVVWAMGIWFVAGLVYSA